MTTSTRVSFALSVALILAACKAENPALTGTPKKPEPVSYSAPAPSPYAAEHEFKFNEKSVFKAQQDQHDKNEIQFSFQVQDAKGKSINKLQKSNIQVFENGKLVTPFDFDFSTRDIKQIAAIQLIVDVTRSMSKFIEPAKNVLISFLEKSARDHYHIRFCVSSFGDYVVKPCNRFYDNTNPDQLREARAEIERLHSYDAKNPKGLMSADPSNPELDPGMEDVEENPMRALLEAANVDWADADSRFSIVVTDVDFYSPDKPNKRQKDGKKTGLLAAPTMKEVNEAILKARTTVFAVTPSAPGYNSPIVTADGSTEKGITQVNNGDWFDFASVIKNAESINPILSRILNEQKTNYKIRYVVEDAGLDPTLALENRKIEVRTNPAGQVSIRGAKSTQPSGRNNYRTAWNISDYEVDARELEVTVNGQPTQYRLKGTEVVFDRAPEDAAQIEAKFRYVSPKLNLSVSPITVRGDANESNTRVFFNGKEARVNQDFVFQRSGQETNISLADGVWAAGDPFGIAARKGLHVKISVTPRQQGSPAAMAARPVR